MKEWIQQCKPFKSTVNKTSPTHVTGNHNLTRTSKNTKNLGICVNLHIIPWKRIQMLSCHKKRVFGCLPSHSNIMQIQNTQRFHNPQSVSRPNKDVTPKIKTSRGGHIAPITPIRVLKPSSNAIDKFTSPKR